MHFMDDEEFEELTEREKLEETAFCEKLFIEDCLKNGGYDRMFMFGNLSFYGHTDTSAYIQYHRRIPGPARYKALIGIYTNSHSTRELRPYLEAVKKYRPDGCDAEIRGLADRSGHLTVYRGACAPHGTRLRKPGQAVSWTIDPGVAHWFASRFPGEQRVYSGIIRLADVIAYENGRREAEIIQSGSVRRITEIPVDPEAGMRWHSGEAEQTCVI